MVLTEPTGKSVDFFLVLLANQCCPFNYKPEAQIRQKAGDV